MTTIPGNACPCGSLGVLMPLEAPHTDPSFCKSALAASLIGARGMNVLDQLGAVIRELERIQAAAARGDCEAVAKHARVALTEMSRGLTLIGGKPPS